MKSTPEKPHKRVIRKLNKKLASNVKHARVSGMDVQPNDRLELLKAKFEQEIQTKKQELAVLEAKLRNVFEFAKESENLKDPDMTENKYATYGLTEAVLHAVGYLWRAGKGADSGITAPQVRDFVIARGFPLVVEPHNFVVAVNVTLKRLAESGRVVSQEVDNKKHYRPVQQPQGRSIRIKSKSRMPTFGL